MNNNESTFVYAVRHGETEWNSMGKQQGHMDSPLTALGTKQAYALAIGLMNRGIELIISSDLGRASKTAEIIAAKLKLSVTTNELLRERHLGSLQGLTIDEWHKKYPNEWSVYKSGDPDYCFPNGESARQRYERAIKCVEALAEQYKGNVILIVTHGGILSGMFYRAIGLPLSAPRRFSLFNASINSFSISRNFWKLCTWGETHHLQGMETLDDN